MHPNILTLLRIAAIPVIILLMFFPGKLASFLSAITFSAAAITDYFDGFYARQKGLVTDFGKVMDPLADKLLVSAAFIMLIPHGRVYAWIVFLIIGRELAVTGLRNIIAVNNQDVSASVLGKYKTGFQIGAIIPLLIHYEYFGIDFHLIGSYLIWIALVLTLWSGADYFIKFRKLLKI